MYNGKKITIIAVLEILNKYSDAGHRLSREKIVELLQSNYEIEVDKKLVTRDLMNLVLFEDNKFDINYTEIPRAGNSPIRTDWYINHKFDSSELRLLIDSLLFSKHIPYSQCKDLIKKLTSLSSEHFESHVKHVYALPENAPSNKAFFSIIDMLDEAIQRRKQVLFNYADYGIDKKKQLRTGAGGAPIEYLVNPYQMVTANGRYYLVGNLDKYDDIAHYRVDRIANLTIAEESKAKPPEKVTGGMNLKQDLPKHMAEHIYMYSGEAVRVTFKADRRIMSDLVDWFGLDFSAIEIDDIFIEVTVKVNESAMFNWAMQYGAYVEVLSPESLREKLTKTVSEMKAKYS